MKTRQDFLKSVGLYVFLALSLAACRKTGIEDITTAPASISNNKNLETQPLAVTNSSWLMNWNSYPDGNYLSTSAITDFGNISEWCDSRAWISAGVLRIRLQPKALSSAGGLISNIRVVDATAYELDYDIRFHSQFEWSRGGKLGFGFLVGDGNTGGNPAWDGNGGSMRLIWYQMTNGRVVFEPYLYYKDQPSTSGDNFATTYPATGSILRGKWYHVHLYIKSNTADNTDGRALMSINGTVVIDKAIRWTTIDSKRFIRNVCFHTFRGGDTPEYMASSLGYIYYDNLVIHRIDDGSAN